MQVAYASDLHLENRDPAFIFPTIAPGTNVLLLVGDLHVGAENYTRMIGKIRATDYQGIILIVLGNHEYETEDFINTSTAYWQAVKSDPQVYILDNNMTVIEDVLFLGSTLWTDVPTLPKYWPEIEKGINDFKYLRDEDKPWTIKRMQEHYREALRFLNQNLYQHPQKKVVMTHFAPSIQSIHAKYAGHYLSPYFYSLLDELIEETQPEFWIHGHIHEESDYQIGKTRVLCNPWGSNQDVKIKYFTI